MIYFLRRLFLSADRGKNRLRCALAEHARTDPGGMDAVHREQAQVGIVNTAVVKIDDRSAVRLCDSLDLRVEISNRISVQIHGGSASISIQITTLQQGAAVDGSCGIERLYF